MNKIPKRGNLVQLIEDNLSTNVTRGDIGKVIWADAKRVRVKFELGEYRNCMETFPLHAVNIVRT